VSKITNDGLTRSGTGCFIATGNSGRQRVTCESVRKQLRRCWHFTSVDHHCGRTYEHSDMAL